MIRYITNNLFKIMIGICITIFLSPTARAAEPFYGSVKRVIDGDSLQIFATNGNLEIRLYGVDAPEHGQRYADEAKRFVKEWIGWQQIRVEPQYRDVYGRIVAIVYKKDKILNQELVGAGMAWVYPQFCRQDICNSWIFKEEEARRGKKGLWRDTRPIPPWIWKRHGGDR